MIERLAQDRFVVEIAGRDVPYFGVLAATVTFATVSLLGAWLLEGRIAAERAPITASRRLGDRDRVVNGHVVLLEPLLRAIALLAGTIIGSALALHATRSPEDESA
jgi:hypothetical protein